MADFVCGTWQQGQACRRYMRVHWAVRTLGALAGSTIAVLPLASNAFYALAQGLPGAIAVWTYAVAFLWGMALLTGFVVALHQEHDFFGCLVTGFGIPGLLYALSHGANSL